MLGKRNISLDEFDFRTLVRGGIVEKKNTRIILKDIGYPYMSMCVEDSYEDFLKSKFGTHEKN